MAVEADGDGDGQCKFDGEFLSAPPSFSDLVAHASESVSFAQKTNYDVSDGM